MRIDQPDVLRVHRVLAGLLAVEAVAGKALGEDRADRLLRLHVGFGDRATRPPWSCTARFCWYSERMTTAAACAASSAAWSSFECHDLAMMVRALEEHRDGQPTEQDLHAHGRRRHHRPRRRHPRAQGRRARRGLRHGRRAQQRHRRAARGARPAGRSRRAASPKCSTSCSTWAASFAFPGIASSARSRSRASSRRWMASTTRCRR